MLQQLIRGLSMCSLRPATYVPVSAYKEIEIETEVRFKLGSGRETRITYVCSGTELADSLRTRSIVNCQANLYSRLPETARKSLSARWLHARNTPEQKGPTCLVRMYICIYASYICAGFLRASVFCLRCSWLIGRDREQDGDGGEDKAGGGRRMHSCSCWS